MTRLCKIVKYVKAAFYERKLSRSIATPLNCGFDDIIEIQKGDE